MDNTVVKPYADALAAQKAKLQGYVADGFGALAVPADAKALPVARKDFLTDSAVCFLVLGAIGIVIALVSRNMGVVMAAAAAILSGGYLYVKGKQAMRATAYANLSSGLYAGIEQVVDGTRSRWSAFMAGQNDSLRKAVVSSAADADAKVALIDKIGSTTDITVNLPEMQADLAAIAAKEDLGAYRAYIDKARSAVSAAVDTADGAQSAIYTALGKA